jgi:hypothetical protein
MYSSTLSSTSALDGGVVVGGQRHAPSALSPERPGNHMKINEEVEIAFRYLLSMKSVNLHCDGVRWDLVRRCPGGDYFGK